MGAVDQPWGWKLIGLLAACFAVLTVDVGHLEGFPSWWWHVIYGVSCVGLVWWRSSFWLPPLIVSTGALFVGSFASAVVFANWEPDRMRGIALNVITMIFAALTLRSQSRFAR